MKGYEVALRIALLLGGIAVLFYSFATDSLLWVGAIILFFLAIYSPRNNDSFTPTGQE